MPGGAVPPAARQTGRLRPPRLGAAVRQGEAGR